MHYLLFITYIIATLSAYAQSKPSTASTANVNQNRVSAAKPSVKQLARVSGQPKSQAASIKPGKDCPIAILVDKFYLSTFSGANNAEKMKNAKIEISNIMKTVNAEFKSEFDIGFPVVLFEQIGAHNDAGFGFDNQSPTSLTLLEKLKSSVDSGRGNLLRRLKNAGAQNEVCASFLLTYQDFKNTVGYSFTGGICNDNGANVGLITFQFENKKIPIDHATKLVIHELGHLLGSSHDDQNACNGIMNPKVPRDASLDFSSCSRTAIQSTLNSPTASCLVGRGNIVPIIA